MIIKLSGNSLFRDYIVFESTYKVFFSCLKVDKSINGIYVALGKSLELSTPGNKT